MTTSDTIGRVARPRGVLTESQRESIEDAREEKEVWAHEYRRRVVRALSEGASFNEVATFTGLSKDTLQRWKREAGA